MNFSEEENSVEEFRFDSESNYKEFLKINRIMKPATSTQISDTLDNRNKSQTNKQLPIRKSQVVYTPYEKRLTVLSSNASQSNKNSAISTPSTSTQINHTLDNSNKSFTSIQLATRINNAIYTSYSKSAATNSNNNVTQQHTSPPETHNTTGQSSLDQRSNFEANAIIIMKATLREIKLLRSEFKSYKENCSCHAALNVNLKELVLPADSVEAFNKLESDVWLEFQKEVFLINHFKTLNDQTMEKFVRGCLKSIITDNAASQFSWHGQHGNIVVKSFKIMALLKDETVKKFNCRVGDIETIIKKWFQYAKDRNKRTNKT